MSNLSYTTVCDHIEESEIKHSRFIGIVRRVRDEDELFAELNKLKKTYSDATHVCYAATFGENGAARFSDDGEPSGTAGAPIYEALKNSALSQTLVAVVRYFGGIKLGAGGLVRAYSSAASSALKNAGKITAELMDEYVLTVDFSAAKRFSSAVTRTIVRVINTEYSSDVKFTLAAPSGSEITQTIADILGAKPNLIMTRTTFIENKL